MKMHNFHSEKIICADKNIKHESKKRSFKNVFVNEELRLIEDESSGIIQTGKGFCFKESHVEAIKEILMRKLSEEERETLKISFDNFCYTITYKKQKKKQEKKSLAFA